jgi:tetratricopeptide (TPR) repeat protein
MKSTHHPGICRLALGCLVAIFVALAVQAATAQQVDEAKAEFRRAELLTRKGDMVGAIESFTRAIALKPGWAEAYLQRAHLRRMHGELDKAVEDYDKATELDPRTTLNNRMAAQAYTNQGQIFALNLRFEDAIVDFDKAIKLFEEDERPYFERARVRLLLEDLSGAIVDYDLYINLNTHDPFSRARGYAERGLAKHLLGRDKEGATDVKKALELAVDDRAIILTDMAELEEQFNVLRRERALRKRAIG